MLYLMHHGVKGQKWGERRYQYKDGSLTPEGRKRYGIGNYIKNRHNIGKARSNDYKRAHSDFQRELADIERTKKGNAQNKPVTRAAKKYDEARRSIRQKYKSAVDAENKKLFKSGKAMLDDKRARLSKGARDSADKVYNNLADKGESGVFGHAVRAAKYSVAAESAATVAGSLLIKQALKNNPNLNVNSSELLKVARKNARRMAVNYARAESAVGAAAAIHRGIRKNDENNI